MLEVMHSIGDVLFLLMLVLSGVYFRGIEKEKASTDIPVLRPLV
jgi:hypothetical protein